MHDMTDLSFDARRAEIEYRTAKLTAARRARPGNRHWWQRGATTTATSSTN